MTLEVAHRAAVAAGWDLMLRGLVAAAGLVLLLRSRRGPKAAVLASWAAVVFVAVDLGSVTVRFLRDGTGPVAYVEAPPPPPVAVAGAADPAARVVSMRRNPVADGSHAPYQGIYTNHWISWRTRSLNGIHGALPRYWDSVLRNGLTRYYQVLRAYGVRYYATDPGTRLDEVIFEPVTRSADEWVYRLRDALGRFYTVPRVEAVDSDQKTADEMASPRFDPTLVAYGTRAAAGSYTGSVDCRLRVVTDQPDRLVLTTESSGPAFVVVADAFFPGWEARLDGTIVPIHRVNLLLRGMAVPAGRHELELVFTPEGWRSAQRVTRVSLAVWMALMGVVAAVSWRARRRAVSS